MTEISILQRQTRIKLQQVLNEKSIVIEEQIRQIFQYRQVIDRFQQIKKGRQKEEIEEHTLDHLFESGFIKKEGTNYYLLVDVTKLIDQNICSFYIDSRIDIVKEIEDDRCKAHQDLNDAFEKLNEEKNELIRKLAHTKNENEKEVQRLKEQIRTTEERLHKTISSLEEKIEFLQDENEMMEIQAKQIKAQVRNKPKEAKFNEGKEQQMQMQIRRLEKDNEKMKNALNSMVNTFQGKQEKIIKNIENHVLMSPAANDISFPIAESPKAKQREGQGQKIKTKHKKKMIRIGY